MSFFRSIKRIEHSIVLYAPLSLIYSITTIDKTIDIDTHHSTGKMQLYINNQKKYYKNHEERVARINSFQ